MLASYSNVGLEEPGQNAANTLALFNQIIFKSKWRINEIAGVKVIIAIRDEVIAEFIKAARRLERDIRSA